MQRPAKQTKTVRAKARWLDRTFKTIQNYSKLTCKDTLLAYWAAWHTTAPGTGTSTSSNRPPQLRQTCLAAATITIHIYQWWISHNVSIFSYCKSHCRSVWSNFLQCSDHLETPSRQWIKMAPSPGPGCRSPLTNDLTRSHSLGHQLSKYPLVN